MLRPAAIQQLRIWAVPICSSICSYAQCVQVWTEPRLASNAADLEQAEEATTELSSSSQMGSAMTTVLKAINDVCSSLAPAHAACAACQAAAIWLQCSWPAIASAAASQTRRLFPSPPLYGHSVLS